MAIAERFDVIVVGARRAGSPLAALLARQGLRVVVLERARFPRDTLSTMSSPRRLLMATGRLLVQRGSNRRALIQEVGGLIAEDTPRTRLNRRPEYGVAGASGDADATEVPEAVAA